MWTSDPAGVAEGSFELLSGDGSLDNKGHAVVVHSAAGGRIGCAVLVAEEEAVAGGPTFAKPIVTYSRPTAAPGGVAAGAAAGEGEGTAVLAVLLVGALVVGAGGDLVVRRLRSESAAIGGGAMFVNVLYDVKDPNSARGRSGVLPAAPVPQGTLSAV